MLPAGAPARLPRLHERTRLPAPHGKANCQNRGALALGKRTRRGLTDTALTSDLCALRQVWQEKSWETTHTTSSSCFTGTAELCRPGPPGSRDKRYTAAESHKRAARSMPQPNTSGPHRRAGHSSRIRRQRQRSRPTPLSSVQIPTQCDLTQTKGTTIHPPHDLSASQLSPAGARRLRPPRAPPRGRLHHVDCPRRACATPHSWPAASLPPAAPVVNGGPSRNAPSACNRKLRELRLAQSAVSARPLSSQRRCRRRGSPPARPRRRRRRPCGAPPAAPPASPRPPWRPTPPGGA